MPNNTAFCEVINRDCEPAEKKRLIAHKVLCESEHVIGHCRPGAEFRVEGDGAYVLKAKRASAACNIMVLDLRHIVLRELQDKNNVKYDDHALLNRHTRFDYNCEKHREWHNCIWSRDGTICELDGNGKLDDSKRFVVVPLNGSYTLKHELLSKNDVLD